MAEVENPIYSAAIYLPVLACLVVLLDIPPLVWHVRNRNLGAAALVGWIITYNFIAFVNALLWPHNDPRYGFRGYVVCDIEVYVVVAGWTGVSTSLLCIMRSLAKVLDTKNQVVTPRRAQRIRQYLIDAATCWALPIVQLGMFDVVKVYRYYIYGISGCVPSLDTSWASVALIYSWPFAIDLLCAYYAVLIMVRLHRYRSEFSRLVHSHNTTRSRFLRLFILCILFLLGILPAQTIILWLNIRARALGFSWARNHLPENRSKIMPIKPYGALLPDRWTSVVGGFLLFLFFGLGTDATNMYRSWATKLNPARIFRRNNTRRRAVFYTTTGSSPVSPSAHSMFSYKTYFTSRRSSSSSAGKSHGSRSLCKSPLSFWRASNAGVAATSPTTDYSRAGSTAPILPLHHLNLHRNPDDDNGNNKVRTLSTASAAPTIDTAISTTPLSKTIRKASVGTLAECDDDDDVASVVSSPVDDAKERMSGSGGNAKGRVEGLGIRMDMASPGTGA
ncbi:Pheromone receptor 2 [Lasiodiplodia hormozganensis]|uniref:Pheromone receptor 2 n=1 Tax=Lasiodiplodia hormozganensis TaxID=869390 RepID=A0AA39Z4W0_9PEZI|nr:Pheromone receptor 2 [Lasiodiplodia hormozganensis]